MDNLDEIFDELDYDTLYYYKNKIKNKNVTIIKIDKGIDYLPESQWDNWIIFQIEGDSRLFKVCRPENSWESEGWETPFEVVKSEKTIVVYEPINKKGRD